MLELLRVSKWFKAEEKGLPRATKGFDSKRFDDYSAFTDSPVFLVNIPAPPVCVLRVKLVDS